MSTPDGWTQSGGALERTFELPSFPEAIAFVNRVAELADQENHHPDLEVGYNKCRVRYSTHAVGGLSENDFICAAKVEALVRLAPGD